MIWRVNLYYWSNEDDVELINIASVDTLHKLAIKYADAVIMGNEKISDNLISLLLILIIM